ncbi:uncharacterized protein LOC126741027 isoform X2 [Anthonomus grandis grandis]|uniref:uncharacterized protein LOC126741027 isoform X2 n=1 Tax=Anthonomus grandis grandis TaxID=2921223 RepID=UPI00216624EE|nr:uncharacterized protein LOC126741027 isoform X2 [Anthonomus grandis grandis]
MKCVEEGFRIRSTYFYKKDIFSLELAYMKIPYKIMNMWTSAILIIFSAALISGAAIEKQNEAVSMFDVIKEKCPQLNKTELFHTLNDIFTKQCVNWMEISTTDSLNNSSIEQCLLLYESMNYFCKRLDQPTGLQYSGLIPTSKAISFFDISTICMSNNSLAHHLTNKTEHNVSKILEPMNCVLTCGGLKQNEAITYEICKYAYFFASFDMNKFLAKAKMQHSILTNSEANSISQADISKVKTNQKNNTMGFANLTAVNSNMTQISESLPTLSQHTSKETVLEQTNKQSAKPQESNPPKVNSVLPGAAVKPITKIPESDVPDANARFPSQMQNPSVKKDNSYKSTNVIDMNDRKDQDDVLGEEGFADQEEDQVEEDNVVKGPKQIFKKVKPSTVEEESVNPYNANDLEGDSNFFSYFSLLMCLCVVGYVGYHNRQKILALILEGKRSKKIGRARRPNSANYHKLDSNLEEAMSSSCAKNASNVIY